MLGVFFLLWFDGVSHFFSGVCPQGVGLPVACTFLLVMLLSLFFSFLFFGALPYKGFVFSSVRRGVVPSGLAPANMSDCVLISAKFYLNISKTFIKCHGNFGRNKNIFISMMNMRIF
jgi:hypothetical protein